MCSSRRRSSIGIVSKSLELNTTSEVTATGNMVRSPRAKTQKDVLSRLGALTQSLDLGNMGVSMSSTNNEGGGGGKSSVGGADSDLAARLSRLRNMQ